MKPPAPSGLGTTMEGMRSEVRIKETGGPGSEVRGLESPFPDSGPRTSDFGLSDPGPGGAGAPLELRLLGPLEARVHGQPLPPPRQNITVA